MGVACHHRLWVAQMVERRRAWHDITALGLHAWSDNIARGMTSPPLDGKHDRMTSGVAMPSSPLSSTHSRTTSGVAFHHSPLMANNVERCRAWLDITALGLHARSDDVGRGMTSPPLDSTHDRQRRAWHDITALGQHTQSDDVGRGMTSPPLGSTYGRTTSGVA